MKESIFSYEKIDSYVVVSFGFLPLNKLLLNKLLRCFLNACIEFAIIILDKTQKVISCFFYIVPKWIFSPVP